MARYHKMVDEASGKLQYETFAKQVPPPPSLHLSLLPDSLSRSMSAPSLSLSLSLPSLSGDKKRPTASGCRGPSHARGAPRQVVFSTSIIPH
jgi:hypothetical protein